MIRRFLKDRRGATAIEYGLIAALLTLAIIVSVGTAGTALEDLWGGTANKIQEAVN